MRAVTLTLAAALAAGPAVAQTLSLSGEAGQQATLSAAQFAALPHLHLQVMQHGQPHAYDGVLLSDLLSRVGAPRGDGIKGRELATVVRVSAHDGYQVVVSLAETDAVTRAARMIVADREAGAPLKPEEGPFRLVIEGDLRPARSARQVERIEVISLSTLSKATPAKGR
ncbi:molybdopterin-dependent oxidoreductase [Phenylobacterium sp.]|uniref:molybdopterin-dependent oxidoreductase n=1 Tax=Phenylobacterium sp. TaxID=1871053 RepID=UPI002E31ECF2|nr:molybdopterin-dependent oxidoreductase [Phenylobacterium sp.]HEX4709222.1 molybdopterin-dependent oxidoreductase [Phenylobacterium sp.]